MAYNQSQHKKCLLVLGTGGVGKTTMAAAIGLCSAKEQKKTLVLTIDPSQRLLQAFQLHEFEKKEIYEISIPELQEKMLFISPLHTNHVFDTIIKKFNKDPKKTESLLSHPIYKALRDGLSGAFEYAALECILDYYEDPTWDNIIIDTAPVENSMELFLAPEKIISFMKPEIFSWFIHHNSSKTFKFFFEHSANFAISVFKKIFGGTFLNSFSDFLQNISGMEEGFSHRHEKILQILKTDTTIVWVTSTHEKSLKESEEITKELQKMHLDLDGVIINQVIKPPKFDNHDIKGSSQALLDFLGKEEHYAKEQMEIIQKIKNNLQIPYMKEIYAIENQDPHNPIALLLTLRESLLPFPFLTTNLSENMNNVM